MKTLAALALSLAACSSPAFQTAGAPLDDAQGAESAPDGGDPGPGDGDASDAPTEAGTDVPDAPPPPPTAVVRCRGYLRCSSCDGGFIWGDPVECGDGAYPSGGKIVGWGDDGDGGTAYSCGPESFEKPVATPCPAGAPCTITTYSPEFGTSTLPGECVP